MKMRKTQGEDYLLLLLGWDVGRVIITLFLGIKISVMDTVKRLGLRDG